MLVLRDAASRYSPHCSQCDTAVNVTNSDNLCNNERSVVQAGMHELGAVQCSTLRRHTLALYLTSVGFRLGADAAADFCQAC